MAEGTATEIPADLLAIAKEKGISDDLLRRALALGFPIDAVRAQMSLPTTTAEATEAFVTEQERIRAGGEVTISPELRAVMEEHGWQDDLVVRALKLGAPEEMIMNQIKAGITPEQALPFIEQQEAARAGGGLASTLDLSWMKVPTEWGIKVRPGKKGLTVQMLNVGTYGDIPDFWPYQTEMPRGAYPIAGVPAMGYSIYEKAELWSDNAADLYEEAIQRRWAPATSIPWETQEPLPDEIEKAMCQVCTYMCEKALLCGDIIGRWLPEMSYGYHEVKLCLSAQELDYARQFEVFRKRAHSNGGGMLVQSPGYQHRGIIDARSWNEASIAMHLVSNSVVMGIYQIGAYVAHNEAESKLFHLVMEDTARQIAYGIGHLRYFLIKHQERRAEIHNYLNKHEAVWNFEWERDQPLREALVILLGGGTSDEQVLDGQRKLEYFMRRWIRDYAFRLAAAGVPERAEKLHPALKKYMPQPEEAAA